jgi:hypothetical protein
MMSSSARKNLIFFWLATITATLGWVAWSQAAADRTVTDFDEINVHRINIIEPDGKPRVIISNRKSMAGLYWGGKEYKHNSRDEGGFLFFNDNGDEVGGLIFQNRTKDGKSSAATRLLFDQYQQGETLGLVYSEEDKQRIAGLRVWDQPNESILPAIELSDKLVKATSDKERAQLKAQLDQMAESLKSKGYFTERFFAGKYRDDSVVKLADKQGRARLLLKVDGNGEPSVEFLDAAGKVTSRIAGKNGAE